MTIRFNSELSILCLLPLLLLCGCSSVIGGNETKDSNTHVTDYDLSFDESVSDSSYDIDNSTFIELNNKDVKIAKGGTYVLEGTLENSSIIVEAKKDMDVQLVLNSVNISSGQLPGIYIKNGNNVIITLSDGSSNTISDLSSEHADSNSLDALIYSETDLIINGNGELNLNSDYKHGIVSKDDLIITGGTFNIETKGQGLRGKDCLKISGGNFYLVTHKDSLKSDNYEDDFEGYVYICGGSFDITSYADAIYGHSLVRIDDGSFKLKTIKSDTTDSFKAIKSKNEIVISDGKLEIESEDDAIHSDKNITINGGKFKIRSKDDGIHSNAKVEINDGDITVEAHEGIESTYVLINGGDIEIVAYDDGVNAGQKAKDYEPTFEMNDGNLTIETGYGDSDGIDSNGFIYINGGTIDITGQSPFDYILGAEFYGGTIIVNGNEIDEITNIYVEPAPEDEEIEEDYEDIDDQDYYDDQSLVEEQIYY